MGEKNGPRGLTPRQAGAVCFVALLPPATRLLPGLCAQTAGRAVGNAVIHGNDDGTAGLGIDDVVETSESADFHGETPLQAPAADMKKAAGGICLRLDSPVMIKISTARRPARDNTHHTSNRSCWRR